MHDVTLPDGNWPLILGDALNCYRSVLDHLVSEHLLLQRGMTVDELAQHKFSFPIADTPKRFKDDTKKLRTFASTTFMDQLEEAQPFVFGPEDTGEYFPLSVLRDLNNLDKHRGLPATESYFDVYDDSLSLDPSITDMDFKYSHVLARDGALLAHAEFAGPITEAHSKIRFGIVRREVIKIPKVENLQTMESVLRAVFKDVLAVLDVFFVEPEPFDGRGQAGCGEYHEGIWYPAHA